MKSPSTRTIRTLAIVIGEVCLINWITATPVNSSSPFYSQFNDVVVASQAVLSAVFAWLLFTAARGRSRLACTAGRAAALFGASLVAAGCALDILNWIGWYNAGLFVTVGSALIGFGLAVINMVALRSKPFPRRIARFGLLAALVMMAGLLAAPFLLTPVSDPGVVPWFVTLGNISGTGGFFLYPIWSFWLGRHLAPKEADTSTVFSF